MGVGAERLCEQIPVTPLALTLFDSVTGPFLCQLRCGLSLGRAMAFTEPQHRTCRGRSRRRLHGDRLLLPVPEYAQIILFLRWLADTPRWPSELGPGRWTQPHDKRDSHSSVVGCTLCGSAAHAPMI
jgi:hypothetical protein